MDAIMDRLTKEGINQVQPTHTHPTHPTPPNPPNPKPQTLQVYVVGGDGTHKGANAISREAARRKYPMTVCGVPKVKP